MTASVPFSCLPAQYPYWLMPILFRPLDLTCLSVDDAAGVVAVDPLLLTRSEKRHRSDATEQCPDGTCRLCSWLPLGSGMPQNVKLCSAVVFAAAIRIANPLLRRRVEGDSERARLRSRRSLDPRIWTCCSNEC